MNLTIEKMIYGGDGLARSPGGKTVFVPLVLAGEEVTIEITEEKTGFIRANLKELLQPSEKRTPPPCPYFGSCGGCHYQHSNYEYQLEMKAAILRETFQRTGKFNWDNEVLIHSSEPWHYRNRTRMKVSTQAGFVLGHHRAASNELLAVEICPISSPLINRAIQRIWELGREQRTPGGISEIEFFADHEDSALLLEIYAVQPIPGLQQFFSDVREHVPELRGMALFSMSGTGASGLPGLVETVEGGWLNYRAGDWTFRVSAGSFFQTNRFLVDDLVRTVVAGVSGRMALDLYSGVGLFANHLSKRFHQVFAVESNPASLADLKANAQKNVSAVQATTEQFLQKSLNLNPDLVVVDPPRAGLGERAAKLLAAQRIPRVTYLSCDPTTLARDLRLLLDFGYRMEEVHLIDLFPQTFHIESLVRLAR
ncbi:MAG TPA: 23S rRNA (uracil(1939)-C(5))-methyltransferase RlmD [Candidatus Angelobacter sp.]